MGKGSQPDVPPGTRDAVLEYESPAAAASMKGRGRQRFLEWLVVLAIIAVLVALLLPPTSPKRTPAIETINKAQAAQYMAALTRHFVERGAYPTKLDDLVPTHLPALPPTQRGTKWWYRPLNNGSAYELQWTQPRYTWKYDPVRDQVIERPVRGQ